MSFPDFLRLAAERGLDVRFIEFMPMGEGTLWSDSTYWPAQEILQEARHLVELGPAESNAALDGPATMHAIRGTKGRFGLITPLSCHFCAGCNRLRLTSDGRLRTCLFDDREYSILPLLRRADITEERRRNLCGALWNAPCSASPSERIFLPGAGMKSPDAP